MIPYVPAVIHGDCLEVMKTLQDKSVDMILCDLPYGTTYAKWDITLPMQLLWDSYSRLIKDNGAMVFTASQPFTSMLICSKPEWFRCEWIWDKHNPTNFANANKQPLKQHESVVVFGKQGTVYYPQKASGNVNHTQGKSKKNVSETRLISGRSPDDATGMKFPKSIIVFPKHSSQCGLHPTQKPVALFEYLIKTYTNEGELVLDNCAGSGTTGIACRNTGRKCILIEKEQSYIDVINDRIANWKQPEELQAQK